MTQGTDVTRFACVTGLSCVIYFPVDLKPSVAGTTNDNPEKVIACGGGAIKIYTEKNLTISK